jgi:hypothetical protein
MMQTRVINVFGSLPWDWWHAVVNIILYVLAIMCLCPWPFASLDRIRREKWIDLPSPRVAWHEELTLTPEPAAASPINKWPFGVLLPALASLPTNIPKRLSRHCLMRGFASRCLSPLLCCLTTEWQMGFLAKWAANMFKDLWQPGQEILGMVNQWARETGERPCCVGWKW